MPACKKSSRDRSPSGAIDRNASSPRHVFPTSADLKRSGIVKRTIVACVTSLGPVLGLSACTNPYDPAQRFVGGGLFGAASGAAMGAAIGAAAGAFGGVATTPPPYGLGYPGYYAYPLYYAYYGYPGYYGYP